MTLIRARIITSSIGLALLCLALLAALLPVSSTPVVAQEETTEADATLRVIHASPGAPEVDVLVDGQPLLANLAYGTVSNYAPLSAEEHRLQIIPTGQTADAAVVDETIDATPGGAYLLAVYGLLNDIGGAIYEVDLAEIEPGMPASACSTSRPMPARSICSKPVATSGSATSLLETPPTTRTWRLAPMARMCVGRTTSS